MSTPFIGEIKLFAINFAPQDWSVCDGQDLPVDQNAALYSLIRDQFGGNGSTTFKLPDFRGRVPVYPSGEYPFYQQGFFGGYEDVTLDQDELPAHRHTFQGTTEEGGAFAPINNMPAKATDIASQDPALNWTAATNLVEMADGVISNTGGSQSHKNVQPSTVLLFCISLSGLYPQRS